MEKVVPRLNEISFWRKNKVEGLVLPNKQGFSPPQPHPFSTPSCLCSCLYCRNNLFETELRKILATYFFLIVDSHDCILV